MELNPSFPMLLVKHLQVDPVERVLPGAHTDGNARSRLGLPGAHSRGEGETSCTSAPHLITLPLMGV